MIADIRHAARSPADFDTTPAMPPFHFVFDVFADAAAYAPRRFIFFAAVTPLTAAAA